MPGDGDHVDFSGGTFHDKVVGKEEHHHYPPPPKPGQIIEGDIPQPPKVFQPRPALLEELDEVLRPQADTGGAVAICAMAGTPGVGKSVLAASYAWACQHANWPIVAWIPAAGEEQILTGLGALADRLGLRGGEDDAAAVALRVKTHLAATREPALVVFDNALEVETVRRWCPSTGATRVIITSRNHAFTRAYPLVEVHAFTPRQATAFLTDYTGIRDDDDGAARVAAELGCLPLALAQAAAVIVRRRITYAAYLDLLRAFPLERYLPRLDGDPYPTGTAQAILLSITQAEESAPGIRDLLEVLAVLSPAGIPRAILYGGGADGSAPDAQVVDSVDEALAILAEASLIGFSEDGTAVLMHRLIQRVLRERATHEDRLSQILQTTTGLLAAYNTTLPDGAATWGARAAVEVLHEQTSTVYAIACRADALNPGLLNLRTWCGQYLHDLADLRRATPLLEQTLADHERVLGADHPSTLASRNNLAYAYESAGDLARAIPLYEQTLADSERVLGADHPSTLTSRNNLASTYESAGDLARAIPLYEQTLADRERVLGADHPDTLASRNNLAYVYESAGDLARAIPLHKQTATDCEQALGADHPSTLTSRNNLASAYYAAGDLARATLLYEQTLADRERVLGADHPSTLTSRNNLASTYESAGDLARAIPLYEQTLADCEQLLGSEHPTTVTVRANLQATRRSAP
ncbi:NB-ARC domain-containing protein [Planomonospora sphaerica]|uniref:NB-ARC domain-containing protein n=1 Tax=Planomonospora sphaerica TaxID=161355 RepID=A0A171DJ94_9ACTN|nr:tetratricopeptide repeat protein [Planomonospora sphaerica]GAT68911.1 NB-ARC domain-containing protein [Planomonospora sphaerica]